MKPRHFVQLETSADIREAFGPLYVPCDAPPAYWQRTQAETWPSPHRPPQRRYTATSARQGQRSVRRSKPCLVACGTP
jgi:NADPH-dependent ferric siderophore reductase